MFSANKNKSERLKRFQHVKPVQTALSGGFLLMLSSGIHIGHGFFRWEGVEVPWVDGATSTMIAFAAVAWFMGSISGFTLTPMVLNFVGYREIYVSNIDKL